MEFEYNNMIFQVGINVPKEIIVSTRVDNLKPNSYFDPILNEQAKNYKYSEIFSVSIPLKDVYNGTLDESLIYESCYGKLWPSIVSELKLKIEKKLQDNH